jgi:hypothetical protein
VSRLARIASQLQRLLAAGLDQVRAGADKLVDTAERDVARSHAGDL